MNTAVLVIDVQQGLCEDPGAAFDCHGTIERINMVTRNAREAEIPVIFIQHESETGNLKYGSTAWQLAESIETPPADRFIRKTTPDSFLRTELASILEEHKAERLVICGMHTEFCVDTTTRRSLALGFTVTLVSDAHTTPGNSVLSPQQVIAHHNVTLSNIMSFGNRVTVVPTADIQFSD